MILILQINVCCFYFLTESVDASKEIAIGILSTIVVGLLVLLIATYIYPFRVNNNNGFPYVRLCAILWRKVMYRRNNPENHHLLEERE